MANTSKMIKLCQVFCGVWMLSVATNSMAEMRGPNSKPSSHQGTDYLECGSRPEMGTPFKICLLIQASEQAKARDDIKEGFLRIKEMNKWMSDWLPTTELSQVNLKAGREPVKIRKELFGLLEFVKQVALESDGAFDPTFNVMWGIYNFKKGEEREATDEELKSRLPLIDWRKLRLEATQSTAFLQSEGMKLGLGAVGQSYAADQLAEYYRAKGYRGGYVDGSGDTIFWGHKPGGALWTTGVRNPLWVDGHEKENEVILRIYGTDFAITTCGDDEKYFIRDGRRVHHIIDPKTGRPARASRQVTVIARRGLEADAWDTAAFVMGYKRAIPILEKKGYRAVIVDAEGRVHLTKGLKKTTGPWGDGYIIHGPLN